MKTFDGTPKADAGLRHAQHTHDFAKSQQELAEIHARLQAPYLDALAAVLVVERETLRRSLAQAGLCLCKMEVRL